MNLYQIGLKFLFILFVSSIEIVVKVPARISIGYKKNGLIHKLFPLPQIHVNTYPLYLGST